jgi:toluene monooxygenase electron transfer component
MSNLPNEDGIWSFIIKKMSAGQGSQFIFEQLSVDDSIGLDGPYGFAFLQMEEAREIVCIGGGSGLSPMVSIARAVAHDPRMQQHKMHMFYGGRGPEDICTPKVVEELGDVAGRVSCFNAISDHDLAKQGEWKGAVGYIHEFVEQELSENLKEYEFYFCGPPPMTQAVQKMLVLDNGVPLEQLHFDRFY